MTPTRPAFRYYGAKWRLAPWIIANLPLHECYVEPYGGSAAVLLRKPRSWLEVFNDKYDQIFNFFRCLREQEAELVRAIELTPYAVKEWELSKLDNPDPVEQARRFYVRSYMSLAGPTAQWETGWRRQKVITKDGNNHKKMTPACITFMQTDHLHEIAERLRGVQLECDDALKIIEVYDSPDTLFYIDPTYPAETRGRWKKHAYAYEMSDKEHIELSAILHSLKGKVVISGYRCELYDRLYTDWPRRDKKTRNNRGNTVTESIWLSHIPQQQSLFYF
jgi:DNA adenine methylase